MDLSDVFARYLATNRGPDGQPPEYGVTAHLEDDLLSVTLTFKADRDYCCMESGCHLTLSAGRRWDGLRYVLNARGIAAPPRFRLRMTVVVEHGARFFDFTKPIPGQRNQYQFSPHVAQTFTDETAEKELS